MTGLEPTLPHTDFRTVFEAAPGLFIVLQPDFTIVAASDAYLNAAHAVREQVLGKCFFDVFPDTGQPSPDGVSPVKSSLERVVRNRTVDAMPARRYEVARSSADGGGFEVKYWSSVNKPVMDPNGEVALIIRQVEDVTDVVRQELEKKTIQEERDLFFKHSFDLLAIVGTDGYFKRLNPAFERVMGYSDAELCARPIVDFLHPDDVEKTKKGIKTLASGVPTIASINRYRCKDGNYRWFSWNTTPIGTRLYTVGRDITEQRKIEEQNIELNLELEQRNEVLEAKIRERVAELQKSEAQVQQLQKMDAIGRLAGGIAHDFNNMLGAIAMDCDFIADDADKPESVREKVKDLRRVTERAAALTRQLLIFSRKQVVQLQTVALNPLIQQLEKMLTRLIGEKITIEMKLAPDLKTVSVDPSQMEQVILNLVVNAKDAMPGGGKITIETSNVYLDEEFVNSHLSVNPGHYVLVAVADTGTGMDAETQTKIFEPFFTTKAVGKGTGLGLTTTYGIIKQCKGTIWVYSELGKGTVFKIYLPIVDKVVETAAPVMTKTPESNGTQTILLVEDDQILRDGFALMLRKRGYEVLVAPGGVEALDVCAKHEGPIHLLLTDMVMQGLSGVDLAQQIRMLRGDIRVLYMSGYTSDTVEDSGLENMSTAEFIQKPFDTKTLVAKVQEVLQASQTSVKKLD